MLRFRNHIDYLKFSLDKLYVVFIPYQMIRMMILIPKTDENNVFSNKYDTNIFIIILILDEPSTSISNMANGKDKELPSFWVPSKTPSVQKAKLTKPDSTIYCPVSGRPLKVKDLIDVKFTPIKDGDKKSVHIKENRYMCAVTHDILSNSVPCAVLKPT